MEHSIELTTMKIDKDYRNRRRFKARIDGIEVIGEVQLIGINLPTEKRSYRLILPPGMKIVEHPDYRAIRRELLLEMISRSCSMMSPDECIR